MLLSMLAPGCNKATNLMPQCIHPVHHCYKYSGIPMQQLSSHDLIRENVHKYHQTSHQPCTESGGAKQVLQRWAPNHEIISELEADQPLGQKRARKVVCKMKCSACNTFDQIGIPSSTF
jgi:hypothetical protein